MFFTTCSRSAAASHAVHVASRLHAVCCTYSMQYMTPADCTRYAVRTVCSMYNMYVIPLLERDSLPSR